MDSLTTHYLARELHARWSGRRVAGCAFDRDPLGVVIATVGATPVRIDLASAEPRGCTDDRAGTGGLLAGWLVGSVSAPVDDRRLVATFEKPGKFRGSPSRTATLEVSLVPSARGAVLRDGGGRRLASVGAPIPAPADPRPELDAADVAHAAGRGDVDALMRGRWMSAALARWLVSDPARAAARYREICDLPAARPARCNGRLAALPWCADPVPVDSLIEPSRSADDARRGDRGPQRARALERMRRELARAAAAPRLRLVADALMALGDVAAAPHEVTVADGAVARVDARPGETPVAAAERLYRDVRSMERALETLPARIAALERQPESPAEPRAATPRGAADAGGPARPFRTYRSSGGLEIWVGRGAASNDRLTFREAAPDDVWLHARDVSGAHVVLRWQRDEPPPARDLAEAALLAAWHSRARGSAVVPVDWTRRKYVRKPRGGAPGLVQVTRAETVFARPSAVAERRLRANR